MDLGPVLVTLTTRRPLVTLLEHTVRGHATSQGPTWPRRVALTFDDGPHPTWTPLILDALERAACVATFFVVGRCVAEHPEIVRDARRRGHEIGMHLFSHERSAVYDDVRFRDELCRSKAQLEDLLGEPARWLRFPYGTKGRQSPRAVFEEHGVRVAHWTYSSLDSQLADPGRMVARVDAGLRPGVIVLLHDNLADAGPSLPAPYRAERNATLAALPGIAGRLRARGLSAVTLTALMSGEAA